MYQFISTNTQQNIEPPYPDIAKLTAMDDTVKRKLLSSKWNDSHIFKFPSRYINYILTERRGIMYVSENIWSSKG
jgi:hypothetical protein